MCLHGQGTGLRQRQASCLGICLANGKAKRGKADRVWKVLIRWQEPGPGELSPSQYVLNTYTSVLAVLETPFTSREALVEKMKACESLLLPNPALLETCDSLTPDQFLAEIDRWQDMVDTVTRIFDFPVPTEKDGKILACGKGRWGQASFESLWLDVTSVYLRLFRDRECICELDLRQCSFDYGETCRANVDRFWPDNISDEALMVIEGDRGHLRQTIYFHPPSDWSSPNPVSEAK